MSAVRLIWKCCIPNDVSMKKACVNSLTQIAQRHGMDTAVIRKEPHGTPSHITGDVINSEELKGYAVHVYVDNKYEPLPNQKGKPNPEMWVLQHKKNKGFVLVREDGTETVRDI